MFAIIKSGTQQFKVSEGDQIKVAHISSPEGSKISFDDVLMAFEDDESLVSESKLSKLKVTATVKKHGKYRKVRVVKFKRRKHYMRTHGHQQDYTELKIESIK